MAKVLPPYDVLRQLLSYDPETGVLTWKSRPLDMFNGDVRICGSWNTRYAGKPALHGVDKNGYRTGNLLSSSTKSHRVAWKMATGEDPMGQIDHINGERTDNRIINLRDVSQNDNQRNSGVRSDNKTGVAGVWRHPSGRYHVFACGNYIASVKTWEDAMAVRMDAEIRLGFNTGRGNRKGRPMPPPSTSGRL